MVDSSLPALEVDHLTISYDKKRTVLDRVSLSVRSGETFGLIGLNGEGKTTLIKCILGLRDVAPDQIKIFGVGNQHRAVRQNLAYLPERFEPPWFLSGIDFIRFAASLYHRGIDRAAIDAKATRIGLRTDALDARVQTYSKGMRQKLGLLATIETGCDLLILDEPMSGLDPRARAQVKDLLVEERARGKTIFLSSHILADMDEICDRVTILNDTQIRYVGTPGDLYAQTGKQNLEKAFLSIIDVPRAA
jgi:ABC-2 type transport system ATP-binding protein